eukprot:Amastigsp_a844996_19.p3 type:complete len:133 gc:universal Amastigsp_a844996_19:726-328(-)
MAFKRRSLYLPPRLPPLFFCSLHERLIMQAARDRRARFAATLCQPPGVERTARSSDGAQPATAMQASGLTAPRAQGAPCRMSLSSASGEIAAAPGSTARIMSEMSSGGSPRATASASKVATSRAPLLPPSMA